MSVYDHNREPERSGPERTAPDPTGLRDQGDHAHYTPAPFRAAPGAGYRPGWVWVPLAVLFLLIVLVMGTGFIYGGAGDSTRGYDNGTLLEQRGGQVTQPGDDVTGSDAPELGVQGEGEERSSIPEAAPPLANDGQ